MINTNTLLEYKNNTEYQEVFLQIFELESYDNKIIEDKTKQLYNLLINVDIFKQLFKEAAATFLSEDLELGIGVLFSYDYLKDFIESIKIYNNTKDISKVAELIKKIKK